MSIRAVAIVFVLIVIIAAGAGGGAYLSMSRRSQAMSAQLDQATQLMKSGEHDKALEVLDAVAAGVKQLWIKPAIDLSQVDAMRLEAAERLGRSDAVRALAGAYLKDHPDSPLRSKARIALGRLAMQSGDEAAAREAFEQVRRDAPESAEAQIAAVGLAQLLAQGNNAVEAQKQLLAVIDKPLPPAVKAEAEKALGEVNIKILFSRVTGEGDMVYTLQKGDNINDLAKKYNATMETILRKNGIANARMLSVGQRLIIPVNDFKLVVDRSKNEMTVLNHGKFFKKYPVRTGMEDYMTPTGDFVILNKKEGPEWKDPKTHRRYPAGDPNNELGTRWMSFMGDMLGIHGTIRPESIGLYSSNGCIGMLKEDVEELFLYIPLRTPITIQGAQDPEIKKRSQAYLASRQEAPPPLSAPDGADS